MTPPPPGKKKGKGGASAVPVPPELAAIGVCVGPEALATSPAPSQPEPSLVFPEDWPTAFELVSAPEAAVSVVDALVARLRFKRTYYLSLLHLVRVGRAVVDPPLCLGWALVGLLSLGMAVLVSFVCCLRVEMVV